MSLSEAIREALDVPNAEASQVQLQDAVVARLHSLAPGASAKRTGYFNHSWAPDIVVAMAGATEQRKVFLRFDVEQPEFELDLNYLADEDPLFVGLVSHQSHDDLRPEASGFDLREALRQHTRESVLVTEAESLDILQRGKEEENDFATATTSVVAGGRGLVDSTVAEELKTDWHEIGDAISSANSGALRTALNRLESFLSDPATTAVENSLLTKWVSAGASAESFPGQREWAIKEREPWEIARYVMSLLRDDTAVDAAVWREVVEAISLTDLGHEIARLGGCTDSEKIGELAAAGMNTWTAKFAHAPQLGAEAMRKFEWEFGAYGLGINLTSRDASFTSNSYRFNRVSKAGSLPSVASMAEVLANRDVVGVGLLTSQASLSLELRATATESVADQVAMHVDANGMGTGFQAAQIKTMEVRVPSANIVARIEFDRSVVKVPSAIPLRSFVLLVAEFVVGMRNDDLDELRERLTNIDSPPGANS